MCMIMIMIPSPADPDSRTLLLVLSLKLLSPAISLPYALSTCSKSMNASNTSSSLLQLPNLHTFMTSSLFIVQCPRSTRFSSVITLARPPTSSSLKTTNRSFRHASPCLWNKLPRQPHSGISSSIYNSPIASLITSSSSVSPLCSSITPSLFHSRLKTYLFHKSCPP